nr:uncharacterized protein LOC129524491 [Gorilla gorilla gorilla]
MRGSVPGPRRQRPWRPGAYSAPETGRAPETFPPRDPGRPSCSHRGLQRAPYLPPGRSRPVGGHGAGAGATGRGITRGGQGWAPPPPPPPPPPREATRPGAGGAQAYRFSLLTTRLLLEDGGGVVSAIQDCLSYPLQCPSLISCLNQNYYQCLLQNEVIGLQSWPSRRFCGLSQLSRCCRCCVSMAARMKMLSSWASGQLQKGEWPSRAGHRRHRMGKDTGDQVPVGFQRPPAFVG